MLCRSREARVRVIEERDIYIDISAFIHHLTSVPPESSWSAMPQHPSLPVFILSFTSSFTVRTEPVRVQRASNARAKQQNGNRAYRVRAVEPAVQRSSSSVEPQVCGMSCSSGSGAAEGGMRAAGVARQANPGRIFSQGAVQAQQRQAAVNAAGRKRSERGARHAWRR